MPMSMLFCMGLSVSHPPTASFLYSVCLYGVSLAPCCVNKMTRCNCVMSLPKFPGMPP
jgi:hypothetical protein